MSTIRHLCSHISPCTSCSTTFLLCSSPTHLFVFIIVNYVTWSRSSFQVLSSHSSLMEKYITVKLQYGTIWGSSSAIFQPNYLRMGKAVLGGPCLWLLICCTNLGNTARRIHDRAVVHQLCPSCLQQSIVLWLYLRQSWQNLVSFYVFSSSSALSFGRPALFGALQLWQYRFAWSCQCSAFIVYMFTLHTAVTLRGNCLCHCSLFHQ